MGHEQHRLLLALPDPQQDFVHVDLGVGIERAERLVHQQYLRLDDQRSHQRGALAHAARQRRRIGVLETLQAGLRDAGRDALLALGLGHAGKLQAVADIVGDGAPGKQRVALEHIADIGRRLARRRPACRRSGSGRCVGLIRVAIMLRTVLLPEPDGPSNATNSPRRTLKETSRTASMAVPAS